MKAKTTQGDEACKIISLPAASLPTRMATKTPRKIAQKPPSDNEVASAFRSLESSVRDIERAARVAFLMTMREGEVDDNEGLALYAVCEVERHAAELRDKFYSAWDGKAAEPYNPERAGD